MACPQPIIDLVNGFRRSKIMFSAVHLGIFDIIAAAPKPQQGLSAAEIACQIVSRDGKRVPNCSIDGLERLLCGCVSIQLLIVANRAHGSNSAHTSGPKRFVATPLAQTYLTTDSPMSFTGYIAHSNTILYPLWSNLESSVVTGHSCWDKSFGDFAEPIAAATSPAIVVKSTRDRIFDHIYNGLDGVRRFMSAMDSVAKVSVPRILTHLDLTWIHTLVDLGGSTGALSIAFIRANPQINAIVVDLPQVVVLAEQMLCEEKEESVPAAVKERIRFHATDFFADPDAIPSGNAYLLSRILHDWDDATCKAKGRPRGDHHLRYAALARPNRALGCSSAGRKHAGTDKRA
ncbi:O-methyltransferase-domain-containing protein [Endogone sp. FLAS-F59071]|nr:O-methyltransferase-domain-containing protein [Endogone sp. FLAS-F59071]|eukprot:RUS22602.1 O-methyltransferase-domain-containing protein [Endogone sp. FLAS-F59071]